MNIHDLPTPALLLDLDILENNLARMQKRIDGFGVALRPHIKTHKCLEIGKRQRQLGSRGITVSTFYEAEQFAQAGFDDITWAFPLPPVYAGKVAELGRKIRLGVVIDSKEAVEHLVTASTQSHSPVHVWLKVDCGYHRAGVDPQSPGAEGLVQFLSDSSPLIFDGILSHSGHAYNGKSRAEILAAANEERTVMVDFADRMRSKGYRIPAVSTGSTPAVSVIENLNGVTEVRPGNYCFHDNTMVALGVCDVRDCAVSVLTSVVSHQAHAEHFIVDAGALALSKDMGATHIDAENGLGVLFEDYPNKNLYRNVKLRTLSQEHGKVVASATSSIEGKFRVGEKVRVLENHSCLTVAHFDEYAVVREEEVVDHWRILRGRS